MMTSPREVTAGVAALLTFGVVFATGLLVGRFGWPAPVPPAPAPACSVAERQAAYDNGYRDAVQDDVVSAQPPRRAALEDVRRDWAIEGRLDCRVVEGAMEPQRP
jgi:hypothetical protein